MQKAEEKYLEFQGLLTAKVKDADLTLKNVREGVELRGQHQPINSYQASPEERVITVLDLLRHFTEFYNF